MIKDSCQKRSCKKALDNELIKVLLEIEDTFIAISATDARIELYKLIVCRFYQIKYSILVDSFSQLEQCLIKATTNWPNLSLDSSFSVTGTVCFESFKKLERFDITKTDLSVIEYVFEYLSTISSKGNKGQFFTPRYVIKELIKPISLENDVQYIADPACGSGGFLSMISRYSNKKQLLFGFDYDSFAIRTAKLSSVLMEADINYLQIDSLNKNDNLLFNNNTICIEDYMKTKIKNFSGFDIIATNPPFGGLIKEKKIIQNFSITNGKNSTRDILFIERCFDLLKEQGKLIIVLPNSFFVDSSLEFQRKWLLTHFKVHGIISLHQDTFLPHTHQKTSVIFATKRYCKEIPQNDEIIFAISEKAGKDSKGKYIYMNTNIDTDLSEAMSKIHF